MEDIELIKIIIANTAMYLGHHYDLSKFSFIQAYIQQLNSVRLQQIAGT